MQQKGPRYKAGALTFWFRMCLYLWLRRRGASRNALARISVGTGLKRPYIDRPCTIVTRTCARVGLSHWAGLKPTPTVWGRRSPSRSLRLRRGPGWAPGACRGPYGLVETDAAPVEA